MHTRRPRLPDRSPHGIQTDPRDVGGEPRERTAGWLQRAAGNRAAAGLLARDADAFAPVKDLSKGSLPASEWDPKTRTKGLAGSALLADIATLAGAGRLEGVSGTAEADIHALRKKDRNDIKPGLNFVAELPGAAGETGFVTSAGEYRGPTLPLDDGGTPKVAIMLGAAAFDHDKAHALATMRHEMRHAEHFLLAVHALARWRGDKQGKQFDAWLEAEVREPDRTLIRERVKGTRANTELLAYAEGLVTSFQFIPQVPDPKLMLPGNYPSAIFELIKAGAQYQGAAPQVASAALDRVRDYCRDVLSSTQRGALVAWVDFLSAYITPKDVPPEHKDADPRYAKVVKDDVKNLGSFFKSIREIALKPGSRK